MQLRGKRAFVYLHGNIMLIGTRSGPGAPVQEDFECPTYKFDMGHVSDLDIGNAIRQALSYCRRIDLVAHDEIMEKHLSIMDVKNLKNLYKNTKSMSVDWRDGIYTACATHQKGIGHFIGIGYEKELPETATDEETGAMVRDVLAHCTTKY